MLVTVYRKNYIIASENFLGNERHPSQIAIYLMSEPKMRFSRFCAALSRLVLSAVNFGDVDPHNASTLIASIHEKKIPFRYLDIFERITGDAHHHEYAEERDETQITQGAVGVLSTQEVLQELGLNSELGNDEGVENITAEGMHSLGLHNGAMEAHLYEVDEVADTKTRQIATEIGAEVVGIQYELVYRDSAPLLLTQRQHEVLGVVTEDETFEPMLTVLCKSHPAIN